MAVHGPPPDGARPRAGTDDAAAPLWLVRAAAIAGRVLVVVAALWVLGVLADRLTFLLVTLAVALLITGIFQPVAAWGRRRLPRDWLAPFAIVLVLLGVTVALTAVLSTRIAEQVPQLLSQLDDASSQLGDRLGIDLPSVPGGDSADDGSDGAGSDGGGADGAAGAAGEAALGAAEAVFRALVGLFLTLVFAFFFLKDGARMWQWLLGKLTPRARDDVDAAGGAAWRTVGAYVRGLTVVALFDAAGIGLGLLALGVPLVLTLTVLQFLGSYIPTIGALVAGAAAVGVAWVDGGATTALLVLVLVVVVQQIGNDVIEPWVMARSLPLHPAVVLVAVTAGGLLWGIAGALLFVPLAAAVTAAATVVWQRHRDPTSRADHDTPGQ